MKFKRKTNIRKFTTFFYVFKPNFVLIYKSK